MNWGRRNLTIANASYLVFCMHDNVCRIRARSHTKPLAQPKACVHVCNFWGGIGGEGRRDEGKETGGELENLASKHSPIAITKSANFLSFFIINF